MREREREGGKTMIEEKGRLSDEEIDQSCASQPIARDRFRYIRFPARESQEEIDSNDAPPSLHFKVRLGKTNPPPEKNVVSS